MSTPQAISYVRFSTPDQAKGASLARQTDLAKRYCEQQGLTLSEKLHDLGISAFKGRNRTGALGRLLQLVEQGKVKRGTHLLVESIDRISRQEPLDALPLLLDLIRQNIVIVTLNDGAIYDRDALNSGKAFMLLAIVQRAHEESATKSKRLRDAWDRKRGRAADGEPFTSRCPAWLSISRDGKSYVVNKAAAAAVRQIFELSAAGVGVRSIEKTLNREQVPPIGNRADSWYGSYVRKILFNRSVLGEFQPHTKRGGKRVPHGPPIEDYYPAVIDKALWHRTHQALKARHKRSPGRTGAWVGLLSGLLVDSLGSPWVHINKHRHQLISDKGRRGIPGHEYASVPAEDFEKLVLLLLLIVWKPNRAEVQEDRLGGVQADLADLTGRLEAVRDGINTGDPSTVKTLVSMVPDLERRQAALADEAERLQAEAGSGGADLLPSYAEQFLADPTDRQIRLQLRQVIREHVEQVVIGGREHLPCEPMKDPATGRWIKRHAGQWVEIEVRMVSGDAIPAKLFLPLRDGVPALRLPVDGDADVAAWTALAATRRIAVTINSEGATFALHEEPIAAGPAMPIVTVWDVDGKVWVHVDAPLGGGGQVDAALEADGLRRGRTRRRIGEGMHAEGVLGEKGEKVAVERVKGLLEGQGLMVQ